MKFRMTLIAVLAAFYTMFGSVAAQHDHHESTPMADDHGDHMDMDMENTSMGAFYFTVTNNGDEADRLVTIESDAAEALEIHSVVMDNGVMQMSPELDGVEIPAGESLTLEPGGYHVMMIGLTESLLNGEEFTATLHFESSGEIEITVPIFINEPDEDEFGDPVQVGDNLEVSNIWARQAPKLDGMATPAASPEATPDYAGH